MDLSTFNLNALATARQNGLNESTPFSIVVLGPTSENLASVKKRITTSYTSPQKVEGSDPEELWLNANDGILYRFNGDWAAVSDFDTVFFRNGTGGGGSGPFTGNTATGPIYLPSTPQSANEAVNKAYVDTLVSGIVAGTSSMKTPIATVAGLRGMSMTGIVDKDLIFVEETGKIYAYDAQAVGTDDSGKTMIRPASGIGRWKTTIQGSLDGGSF